MKVTVCFGNTRVIVPCGNGDIPVNELVSKAVTRYKKAKGKNNDYWVTVHNLKSGGDGGILDPDDLLCDVVDDKDQLIAIYEEEGQQSVPVGVRGVHPHHEGDGTSDSSIGTESPDLYNPVRGGHEGDGDAEPPLGTTDVQVTAEDLASGAPYLLVRHGSDSPFIGVEDETKSWRSLPQSQSSNNPVDGAQGSSQSLSNMGASHTSSLASLPSRTGPSPSPPPSALGPFIKSASGRFERGSGRQSMLRNQTMDKWGDAQDRLLNRGSSSPPPPQIPTAQRREPVGGSPEPRRTLFTPPKNNDAEDEEIEATPRNAGASALDDLPSPISDSASPASSNSPKFSSTQISSPTMNPSPIHSELAAVDDDELIVLPNEETPLGIHVIPDYDENKVSQGLYVQSIENGGRIDRDGRLKAGDRIVEINNSSLVALDFRRAQDVFREALLTDAVRLRVYKEALDPPQAPPIVVSKPSRNPPPIAPKPSRNRLSTIRSEAEAKYEGDNSPRETAVGEETSPKSMAEEIGAEAAGPVSPLSNSKSSRNDDDDDREDDDDDDESTFLRTSSNKTPGKSSVNFNTRKIGKKLYIQLSKGAHGLGFSITTRDNSTGAPSPIYIKNILPRGAAIVDGRLRSGDRLLEVNGQEMSGKSQAEAVSFLRSIKLGCVVNLVVSRQVPLEPNLPRKIPSEKMTEEDIADTRQREILTFNVPLNATEAAGLGISVKGKTTTGPHGSQDLGIFIKSIIQGGAASKDTRLRVNDQLIGINGYSLLGMSNQEAMESLRSSMLKDAPVRGHISLVVARRVGDEGNSYSSRSGSGSTTPEVMSPNLVCFPPDAPVSSPTPRDATYNVANASDGSNPVSSPEPPAPFNNPLNKEDEVSDGESVSSSEFHMPATVPPPPKDDDGDESVFASDLDSMRHPVLDRITGNTPIHSPSNAASNNSPNNPPIYNNSYLEATSISFREGLRPPSTSSAAASRSSLDRSWGEAPAAVSAKDVVITDEKLQGECASNKNDKSKDDDDSDSEPSRKRSVDQISRARSEDDLSSAGEQFSRDGIGRQSISEKRHGTIDAKTTKQYWEIKAKRGESPTKLSGKDNGILQRPKTTHFEGVDILSLIKAAEQKGVIMGMGAGGGAVGGEEREVKAREDGDEKTIAKVAPLRKSASLESLQKVIQKRESESAKGADCRGAMSPSRGRSRVSRGKKKNESFRAAVDRSLDPDGRNAGEQRTRSQPGNEEDEDPELTAAASRGGALEEAVADAAVTESRHNRVRSAASASSERSADRSLDELEDEATSPNATGARKKEMKKEKNKSGLLKGLFGSKKNKSGDKKSGLRPKSADPELARRGRDTADNDLPLFNPQIMTRSSSRGYPLSNAQQQQQHADPAFLHQNYLGDQTQIGTFPPPQHQNQQRLQPMPAVNGQRQNLPPPPSYQQQHHHPHYQNPYQLNSNPYQSLNHVQAQVQASNQKYPPPSHHYITDRNLAQQQQIQQQKLMQQHHLQQQQQQKMLHMQHNDRVSVSSATSISALQTQRLPHQISHARVPPVPLHHVNHPYHPHQQPLPPPVNRIPPPSSTNPYGSLSAPQPWRPPPPSVNDSKINLRSGQHHPPNGALVNNNIDPSGRQSVSSIPYGEYKDPRNLYQQSVPGVTQGRANPMGPVSHYASGKAAQV